MARAKNRSHKHFQLDATKTKRSQTPLQGKTETEIIECTKLSELEETG
jgi:hypothetical protein